MNSIKKFVITGAGFGNTGAQSMILVTVSELRKRYTNCEIVILNSSQAKSKEMDKYLFHYVLCNPESELYLAGNRLVKILIRMKNIVRKLLGKRVIPMSVYENTLQGSSALIDISGYALSSQWPYKNVWKYLNRIKIAFKNDIPVFILPQSFGPFDYKGWRKKKMNSIIKKTLRIPQIIFVREQNGKDILENDFMLLNVKYSYDLVLQNNRLDLENIFKSPVYIEDFLYNTDKLGVAIIPNVHSFDINPIKLLDIYKSIIEVLLRQDEKIYIVQHSLPDEEICKILKETFFYEKNVVLITNNPDCLEFDMLLLHFKYTIASRYHSIVHAYKHGVPCLVFGWAEKYIELLNHFEQQKYMFDVRNLPDVSYVMKIFKEMNKNWVNEQAIIKSKIKKIQKTNCFDEIEKYI